MQVLFPFCVQILSTQVYMVHAIATRPIMGDRRRVCLSVLRIRIKEGGGVASAGPVLSRFCGRSHGIC